MSLPDRLLASYEWRGRSQMPARQVLPGRRPSATKAVKAVRAVTSVKAVRAQGRKRPAGRPGGPT
ncbi:hypothetical protein, partial [Streptomyces sp. NPDC054838]